MPSTDRIVLVVAGGFSGCRYPIRACKVHEMGIHEIKNVDDVTDEIVQYAVDIVDGWYPEGPIDWGNVWDRLDGAELENGNRLDLGGDLLSPGLRALKSAVRRARRHG